VVVVSIDFIFVLTSQANMIRWRPESLEQEEGNERSQEGD
jgi:hypothetical protein